MDGARIDSIELLRVAMTLRDPIVTAYGTERERDVVLVHVRADGAEGWGECAALPEPTYAPEYVRGALDVMERHLAPRLIGATADEATIDRALAPIVGHPMAKAALEMAVMDLGLRTLGRSLAVELGATSSCVTAGRTVGIERDLGALRADVDAAVDAGYRHLKLKITPGHDAKPIEGARRDHPDIGLRADANGSYDPTSTLDALDALGLDAIEQPFPVEHDAAHAQLATTLRTPIAIDEDVTSVASGEQLLSAGAADLVVIKPGRLGGLRRALALGRAAHGRAWIGGMYETGLARAANLALAACGDAFALPVDWSASDRYWDVDLTAPHVLRADGTIAVPTGPGLGVSPDPDVLAARVQERRRVRT